MDSSKSIARRAKMRISRDAESEGSGEMLDSEDGEVSADDTSEDETDLAISQIRAAHYAQQAAAARRRQRPGPKSRKLVMSQKRKMEAVKTFHDFTKKLKQDTGIRIRSLKGGDLLELDDILTESDEKSDTSDGISEDDFEVNPSAVLELEQGNESYIDPETGDIVEPVKVEKKSEPVNDVDISVTPSSEPKTLTIGDIINESDIGLPKNVEISDIIEGSELSMDKNSDEMVVDNDGENEGDFDITEKLKEMGADISVTPVKKEGEENDESSDANKADEDDEKKNSANSNAMNVRRNIRDVMDEKQLDASTLAAQRQESERLARVQEQQRIIREVQRQIAINRHNKAQARNLALLQSGGASLLKKNASGIPGHKLNLPNTTMVKVPGSETKKHLIRPGSQLEVVRLPKAGVPGHKVQKAEPKSDRKEVVEIVDSSSSGEDSSDSTSDSDDCIMLSDSEVPASPEPEEDPQNSGLHVNDTYNIPDEQGRVVINIGHPENEEDIFLAPQIARIIKPHQIGGVRFLFDNIIESTERFSTSTGFGCILAHSMGLGKTLQIVCFTDIFLRHTSSKTVLCIMPINTLQNWVAEFNMWLPVDASTSSLTAQGEVRARNFPIYVLNDSHKTLVARAKVVQDWRTTGGVLMIGYELYRLLSMKKEKKPRRKKKEPTAKGGKEGKADKNGEDKPSEKDSKTGDDSNMEANTDSKISDDTQGSSDNTNQSKMEEKDSDKDKKDTKSVEDGDTKDAEKESKDKEDEPTDQVKKLLEDMYESLVKPGPDLVICDEGHRIKNSHSNISYALKQMRTKRRVVLTGYPLQNNLLEYWCMVDFVRPNYLGTKTEFSNMFERPIQNGQCIDSTPQDIRLMRYRAHVLHSLLVGFVQRRSHAVLQSTLPQKEEYVLLVRMTPLQRELYQTFMREVVRSKAVPNPLKAFAICCKIWNHPDVLYYFLKKRTEINLAVELDLDLEEIAGVTAAKGRAAVKGRPPAKGKPRQPRKDKKGNAKKPAATISPNTSNANIPPNTQPEPNPYPPNPQPYPPYGPQGFPPQQYPPDPNYPPYPYSQQPNNYYANDGYNQNYSGYEGYPQQPPYGTEFNNYNQTNPPQTPENYNQNPNYNQPPYWGNDYYGNPPYYNQNQPYPNNQSNQNQPYPNNQSEYPQNQTLQSYNGSQTPYPNNQTQPPYPNPNPQGNYPNAQNPASYPEPQNPAPYPNNAQYPTNETPVPFEGNPPAPYVNNTPAAPPYSSETSYAENQTAPAPFVTANDRSTPYPNSQTPQNYPTNGPAQYAAPYNPYPQSDGTSTYPPPYNVNRGAAPYSNYDPARNDNQNTNSSVDSVTATCTAPPNAVAPYANSNNLEQTATPYNYDVQNRDSYNDTTPNAVGEVPNNYDSYPGLVNNLETKPALDSNDDSLTPWPLGTGSLKTEEATLELSDVKAEIKSESDDGEVKIEDLDTKKIIQNDIKNEFKTDVKEDVKHNLKNENEMLSLKDEKDVKTLESNDKNNSDMKVPKKTTKSRKAAAGKEKGTPPKEKPVKPKPNKKEPKPKAKPRVAKPRAKTVKERKSSKDKEKDKDKNDDSGSEKESDKEVEKRDKEEEALQAKKNEELTYDWATELLKDYIPGIIENSAKMEILFCILNESIKKGDRVLLFSQSLFTLNLIEDFLGRNYVPGKDYLWSRNNNYFRLDGSTSALEREKLINEFNNNPNIFLFLVSTRAGSLGINLVGANRVVVFDASWNPCHDTQAVCRVYRYGQQKPCFVYRLVMDCCLEKKIYDRQINKQGMADRVVDECNPDAVLSMKEITNLCWDNDEKESEIKDFNVASDKYRDDIMQLIVTGHPKTLNKEPFQHESLLVDRKEKKLSSAEKRLAQRGYELEKKAALAPKPVGQYRTVRAADGTLVQRPVASVRPTQHGARWIPADVWRRQGMSAQEMILPLDVVIPTNSGEKSNIVLKAGQRVMVLKSPKGIYMQLESGKIIAIKTSLKVGQNKDKEAGGAIGKKIMGARPSTANLPGSLKNNSAITVIPKGGRGGAIPKVLSRPSAMNKNLTMRPVLGSQKMQDFRPRSANMQARPFSLLRGRGGMQPIRSGRPFTMQQKHVTIKPTNSAAKEEKQNEDLDDWDSNLDPASSTNSNQSSITGNGTKLDLEEDESRRHLQEVNTDSEEENEHRTTSLKRVLQPTVPEYVSEDSSQEKTYVDLSDKSESKITTKAPLRKVGPQSSKTETLKECSFPIKTNMKETDYKNLTIRRTVVPTALEFSKQNLKDAAKEMQNRNDVLNQTKYSSPKETGPFSLLANEKFPTESALEDKSLLRTTPVFNAHPLTPASVETIDLDNRNHSKYKPNLVEKKPSKISSLKNYRHQRSLLNKPQQSPLSSGMKSSPGSSGAPTPPLASPSPQPSTYSSESTPFETSLSRLEKTAISISRVPKSGVSDFRQSLNDITRSSSPTATGEVPPDGPAPLYKPGPKSRKKKLQVAETPLAKTRADFSEDSSSQSSMATETSSSKGGDLRQGFGQYRGPSPVQSFGDSQSYHSPAGSRGSEAPTLPTPQPYPSPYPGYPSAGSPYTYPASSYYPPYGGSPPVSYPGQSYSQYPPYAPSTAPAQPIAGEPYATPQPTYPYAPHVPHAPNTPAAAYPPNQQW